jgi:enoyl-[acyl-carrier protein] reductase I
MAHLAEPLMKNGGNDVHHDLLRQPDGGRELQCDGRRRRRRFEAAVRYIAAELGPKGIRVHAISPGPLATRAASGIPEFDELMDKAQSKAPSRSPRQH